ncbi:MAG: indolepyruvate ferredoxin oxidoreductase subunit alpha [Candidatus Sumerlaeota bacterium]
MAEEMIQSKLLMAGNEAVARGAADGAVDVACAYPGTPSTEILETIAARHAEIDAAWSPNEKVALEVGMGAAFTGARVLVTMKHVGVNVAADPLFTLSYTGTKGGLVIVTADDPAMHSSQNEQDNRQYAPFAKIPMLEPSDSQEAYDFMRLGLELSERYDTPIFLRMTTRVCHSKSVVHTRPPEKIEREKVFEKDQSKWVMVPAYARARHAVIEKRTETVREWAESEESVNRIEPGEGKVGIITAGVPYTYVKEIMPDAPVLKLGMCHPLPDKMIRTFCEGLDEVYVIEELAPYLENYLKAMGIEVKTKPVEMRQNELNPDKVADILGVERKSVEVPEDLPGARPPVLCPGCPHRATYTVLKKLKTTVTGDIGCYTLGALPPLVSVDTCVCMGGGMGHAMGMSKVLDEDKRKKVVAVIGDSTFVHSGLTGLIDMVYNGGDTTTLILDNRTTAMTGGQDHPATGKALSGKDAPEMDIEAVCRAIGVKFVETVNPYELEESERVVRAAMDHDGPAVVIEKAPCVLIDRKKRIIPYAVDAAACKACGLCARTGCPAISESDDSYEINPERCRACGLCEQLCKFGAISQAGG